MNAQYDVEVAAQSIGILLHETLEGDPLQDIVHLCDVQTVAYAACAVQEPRSYRITESNSTEFFETTFKIRGVMCQSNLPPVMQIRPGIPGHRLRQSVTLSALGSHPKFDKYVTMLKEFVDLFRNTFPEDKFVIDAFHTYEGHQCIVLFNRYLSFRRDNPTTLQIPFDPEIDPIGIMRNHPYQNMHHIEENQVLYSHRELVNGQQSFSKAKPTSFKNGDLVEVHFSIVAYPSNGKEPRRIGCVMRHLILLNDRIRKESERTSNTPALHPVKFRSLKRKQVFVHDETEEGGKRMRS